MGLSAHTRIIAPCTASKRRSGDANLPLLACASLLLLPFGLSQGPRRTPVLVELFTSKGRSSGRTLRHAGAVRLLSPIGSLKKVAKGSVTFSLHSPDPVEGTRLVIFAQGRNARPILGAASRAMHAQDQAITSINP